MISNIRYWFLLLLVLLVYVAGIFVPLFENDSARFAVIAMQMVQENDYLALLAGAETNFDEPHMHFWLAAFSYKIFGIYYWAYRIPAILATLLAAYSCFGLGGLLYNTKVGKLAALVFLTTQIIVMSNTDVRIDTILTGFSIFALWQLIIYLEKGSLSGIVLGAIGAGIVFSLAGLTGLLFVVLPFSCHLLYTRNWKRLYGWKIGLAILLFCLSIIPACYAFFLRHQHIMPDSGNQSGMLSFLAEISTTPLGGYGFSFESFDLSFVKNYLWLFLPWSIIGLFAYANRFKSLIKLKFGFNPKYEFLSLGGVTLLFLVLVFVDDKSFYHLNPLMALSSIMVASYLYNLNRFRNEKMIKAVLGIQYFIFGIVFLISVLFCYYIFKTDNPLNYIWKTALAILAIFYCLKRESYFYRLITVSAVCSLMLNAVLNTHSFPEFMKYQGGHTMANIITKKEIPTENIYKLSDQGTWVLDFYNKNRLKQISISKILNKKDIWVYANELQLRELNNLGYDWDRQYQVDQFYLTQLNFKFLNPATRNGILDKMYLIHIY